MAEQGAEELSGCWGRAGVGCVTLFAGAISGGMVGVLVSKIVAFFTRAPACPGVPSCNWHVYAGVGILVGSLSLFALAMLRTRRGGSRGRGDGGTTGHSDRG